MQTRMLVRTICIGKSFLIAAILLANARCYQASYELALYKGADRLSDGPFFEHQRSNTDCGLAAAIMMLRLSGQPADYKALSREIRMSRVGLSLAQIRDLMLENKLATRGLSVDPENLDSVTLPFMAWLPTHHVVVVERLTPDSAVISDPARGRWKVSRSALSRAWDGIALVPSESPLQPHLQ